MSDPRGLSPKESRVYHPFRTFFPLIIIAVLAIGLSLLSYHYSILMSERIATAATQDLKDNSRIQSHDLSKSLENRLESVRCNLEILANAPPIQAGEYSQGRALINAAEDTTEGLTDSYFWIDEMGKLQWAGAFVDQKVYDQYYGADRTDKPYFTEPRDTHQPYFSTLRDSVDGVRRIYTAYPIIASDGEMFKGVLVASMNLGSLGNSVTEQLAPYNQGAVSLLDRNGTILYTQNDALLGKNYFSSGVQSLLFTNYLPANQKDTFNAIIRDSIAGSSGTVEYSSSGVPLILAYNPVMFEEAHEEGQGNRQQPAMSLHLTLPKSFASDVVLLIDQQRNLSTIVPAAIGAVAVAIALMIIRWNSKLECTVKERTIKLEAANRQLEAKEQAQREFINIAAHELRTPIQPILGLSTIIRERISNLARQLQRGNKEVVYEPLQDPTAITARSDSIDRASSLSSSIEETVPMVDVINRNAKRLEKLTNNLLDISRIENEKSLDLSKEKFDLRQLIENVIDDVRNLIPQEKDIQIRFESNVKKSSVMVEGDKERIFEVISNFLYNAIKFTEEGEIVVVLDEKDGQAMVSVRDTGSGIAPEIYPKLFTKFTTKSERGTGLGLFIAKNIVEAHGGKIWAENNSDGRGATFTFSLPTPMYDTDGGMTNQKR
jgi:signal transduction histidine kinase